MKPQETTWLRKPTRGIKKQQDVEEERKIEEQGRDGLAGLYEDFKLYFLTENFLYEIV